MREKLNENPVAQIAIVAVLLLAVGIFLIKGLSGGESESETAPPTAEATPGGEEAVPAPGIEESAQASTATTVTTPTDRPLPGDIEKAYASGKTIALLIARSGGIDDRLLGEAADVLKEMPSVAFFTTPSAKIARYAAITGPLGVNQAPALIVIRSRKFNEGASAPATITYGFHGAADIRQAVLDADYRGPKLTYAPN